jgi:hypothetical protein
MREKNRNDALVRIEPLIITLRGERVILDSDLAILYSVKTKVLNQAIKRNREKFPEDFLFQLTEDEYNRLIARFPTSKSIGNMRSQFVTASKRNIRFLPYAFTEHGAIMAANVLNSPRAIQMSVFVVRAFVKMREALSANKRLMEKLAELEKKLTGRLDVHERAIVHILEKIKRLMEPPTLREPKRRPIGFGRLGEEK